MTSPLTGTVLASNDARRMMGGRTIRVALLASLLVLAIAAADATAKPARSKLRHELAMLKAKVAELESRLQFESRRFETMMPTVIGIAGGLCADPCATDSDDDGINDCEDYCPCDAANADTDADGMMDCYDPCPGDAENACVDPCRMDSDGDGVPDCKDPCPWDPAASTDTDADDIPDCIDPCPNDPTNDCFEPCPLDSDGDGTKDCVDPCPFGASSNSPCLDLPPGTTAK